MIGGCPFGLPAFFILAIILNTFSFPTELYHMGKKKPAVRAGFYVCCGDIML